MAFTALTGGAPDTGFTTKLNNNFYSGTRVLSHNITSSTANTSTYTNMASHTIASSLSSTINKGILIMVTAYSTFNGSGNGSLGTAAHGALDIKVGTSGAEASKLELSPMVYAYGYSSGGGTDTHGGSGTNTYFCYYEPSAGEKSSGFNVLIQGKYVVTAGSSSATVTHYQSVVFATYDA